MTTLDLGALVGRVALDDVQFQTTYVRVVRQMADLGVQAERSSAGTTGLDTSLTGVAASSKAATTGLGGVNTALTETGVSASRAAVAVGRAVDVTTEAGLASSRLTQATLRQTVARERLTELEAAGTASTRQLAGAQASLIAATDRATLAEERLGKATTVVGRSRAAWAAIPGPAKIAAAAIAVAGVESLKAASNYQKLTVNLVTGAGEAQRNLSMVADGILHMAGAVGDSASDLAKAMFLVESAGFHGAAALMLLRTAAEGAKVDNADLTTVVDALTSAMNAYHEPATKAAMVTNTLIASAAVGKMHLQDLAASLGTVLPSAAALRVPLDQVGAALATMTMQGTNADRAATYLRFSFAALANPTAKAQAAMKAVGLTSEQVATTMTHGGLPAVFTLLQTAVGEKFPAGSAKYLAALANMVGGTRGLQAVLELTGQNLTTMNANLTSIQDRVKGAGNTVSDWAQVQANLNVQWSKFVDGLGAAGIKMGEDLMPAATALLATLNTTGHVVGEITGFFEHDQAAAHALAVVLLMTLEPALSRVAIAAGTAVKAFAIGRFGAAGAALKGLGAAGFIGRVGVAAVAFEALNAAGDLQHLHDTVDNLHKTLAKPLTGNSLFTDLAAEQNAISDAFDKANHTGANYFQNLGSWAAHPIQTFNDAIGKTDEGIKATQVQLDAAYGGFRDLVLAMHQWPTPDAETQTAMVIKAMGLSAQDLATRNFPALLQAVRSWIAANRESHQPAATAHADIVALKSGALSATDAIKALDDAWSNLVGNFIGAKQAELDAKNELVALDKALKHSHGSLSDNTQAGRDAQAALLSLGGQISTVVDAVYKQTGSYSAAKKAADVWLQGIKDSGAAGPVVKHLTDDIHSYLRKLASQAPQLGADFGQGYAAGIRSARIAADAAASDLALAAKAGIYNTQQSHSPSKVAMEQGRFFGEGYALGIDSTTGLAGAAAARVAGRAADAARNSSGAAGYRHVTGQDRSLDQLMRMVTRATNDAQKASQAHAQALADEASKAHEAAANMRNASKHAKADAEAHARALDQEARAAREAASALGNSNSGTVKALTHLVAAADKIAAKARAASQNVSSSLLGDTGFGALGNQTDSFGNPLPGGGSPAQIISTLTTQQAALHKIRQRLRREHAHGLSYRAEEAIAALGLDTGGGIASTLAGATPPELREISRLFGGIGKAARGVGHDIAGGMYGQGIDRLIREQHGSKQLLAEMLNVLRGDTRLDDTSIRRLAREIGKQFDLTVITDTAKQDHKQGQRVLAH